MRFIGLTLCLLASSLGARAESAEDRIGALEARVKALEQALRDAGEKPPMAPPVAAVVAAPVAVSDRLDLVTSP